MAFLLCVAKGDVIVLKSVFVMLVFATSISCAQLSGSLTGKVLDAHSKRPLEGANVVVQGTAYGSATAKDGAYRLEQIPVGSYSLTVSYVGYAKQVVPVEITTMVQKALIVELEPIALPGQTVVVNAMMGRERETPATFSTVTAEEIARKYTFQDIPVLLSDLPSTTYYSESGNGLGYNYVTLRGFDQRRISVMINGIPQNDPEDHNVYWLDFPDLLATTQSIQVQRGGGSAFYGPPAIGGSINIVTTAVSQDRNVTVEAGAGSYNTRRYSVGINSGLVDNRYVVLGRLSRLKSSGYRDQSWSDFSGYFLGAVRYDDNMTTQINLYGGPFKDHLAYYGIPKADIKDRQKRKANPIQRPEEIENFSQPHYELLHEWRPGERIVVNNTFFLIEGEGFFDFDASWADTTMLRITRKNGFNPVANPTNTIIHSFVDNTQYGWLPRITYEYGSGSATAGLELRRHRSHHYGTLRWAQNLPASWNGLATADYRFYEYRGGKDIFSVYVHNIYRLQSNVTLMANLQYVFNRYSLWDEKFVGTEFDIDYHFLNPRIGVNVNLTDQLHAYVNVAYTSREPRRKNLYDATFSWTGEVPQFETTAGGGYDFSKPLVKPEKLLDLELGAGYMKEGLRLQANLYWMDFRDEIIKRGQLDLFGQPVTGNADWTRHAGLELVGLVRLIDGFELSANATYSVNTIVEHTTYEKVKNPLTGKREVLPFKLDGKRLAGFPDFMANARLTYQAEEWFASLSMQHVGDQFTDNFENPNRVVDAYAVFNALAGYRLENLLGLGGVEFRIQINNIFDALYASYGSGDEFFPAAERNLFTSIKIEL